MAASATATSLRILLFGKSPADMMRLTHFIREHNQKNPKNFRHSLTVAQPLDIFSHPVGTVKHELKKCIAQCHPGPNVVLLLVKPSDFTEENRKKLNFVLSFFGHESLKHLMVIKTQKDGVRNSSVNQLIEDCFHNVYTIDLDERNLHDYDPQELIEKMEIIVLRNWRRHLNFSDESDVLQCPKGSGFPVEDKHHTSVSRHASFLLRSNYQAENRLLQRETPLRNTMTPKPVARAKLLRYGCDRSVETEPLRMVLIGMTGSGKSATGNTILGQNYFESKVCINSVTRQCESKSGEINGRRVAVVDTPGLFDTSFSNESTKREIVKCISFLAPGPHVFLLVLKIGRFTMEERITVDLITTLFGEKSIDFTIIIFTRGDELKGKSIDHYLATDTEGSLRELTRKCGGRYLVFNNNNQKNRSQVNQLLAKVDAMVKKNGNSYYTTEMFKEAEKVIDEETQRILNEKEPGTPLKQGTLMIGDKEEKKETDAESNYELVLASQEKLCQQNKELIREMEEKIKLDEEKRKQKVEKKKREDELLLQNWQRSLESLKSGLKSAQESDTLLQYRAKLMKEKHAWELEKTTWEKQKEEEEKRHRENQKLLQKLKESYEKKLQNYESTRKEEARLRKEIEEKQLKKNQEDEEEAMKHAQGGIYIERIYKILVSDKIDMHATQTIALTQHVQTQEIIKYLLKDKANNKAYETLRMKQLKEEDELKLKQTKTDNLNEEMSQLKRRHEEEVRQWIFQRLDAHTKKTCSIL